MPTTVLAVMLFAACAEPADPGVMTLAPHALAGPIPASDTARFTGTTLIAHDLQFVAFETDRGWYVDAGDPIAAGLCGVDSLDDRRFRAIQFYTCDVDPPDGTFYEKLVGVVFCDLERSVCSDLVPMDGFDAGGAEHGFPDVVVHDDVFELLDQRFQLAPQAPNDIARATLLLALGALLVLGRIPRPA